jgi:hypothetical protein
MSIPMMTEFGCSNDLVLEYVYTYASLLDVEHT